jgi:hypothetical protein
MISIWYQFVRPALPSSQPKQISIDWIDGGGGGGGGLFSPFNSISLSKHLRCAAVQRWKQKTGAADWTTNGAIPFYLRPVYFLYTAASMGHLQQFLPTHLHYVDWETCFFLLASTTTKAATAGFSICIVG